MTEVQAVTREDTHVADVHGLAVEVAGYDHRRCSRRRGQALADAINEAVVAELAERGYGAFTFEGVAARAGTGKSTLYRRWADKPTMVVDCLAASMPDTESFRSTGSLRDDLLAVLGTYADKCEGTVGVALRVVCGEASVAADVRQVWDERVVQPGLVLLRELIQSAVDRGEARPGATADECVYVGPALIGNLYMRDSVPPPPEAVARLVDNVLIPMLEAR